VELFLAKIPKTSLSEATAAALRNYARERPCNVVLLNERIAPAYLHALQQGIESGALLSIEPSLSKARGTNIPRLFKRLSGHVQTPAQEVSGIKKLENEIVHFKHIRVLKTPDFNEGNLEQLKESIERVKKAPGPSREELKKQFEAHEINLETYTNSILASANEMPEVKLRELVITNIAHHYYLPLVYSLKDRADYIQHIIKHESERIFIQKLGDFIAEHNTNNWMFSKIDENLDNMGMPYFDGTAYRKFYPDFIFWQNRATDYRIFFVDPKGTMASGYQKKVDDFKRLFLDTAGQPRVFKACGFTVTFGLRLIGDASSVGAEYAGFWQSAGDFFRELL
jgi:hypothetical protein